MNRKSTYEKFPVIAVPGFADAVVTGWDAIAQTLRQRLGESGNRILIVETYPGVLHDEVLPALRERIKPRQFIDTCALLLPEAVIRQLVAPDVPATEPVFGHLTHLRMADLFDPEKLAGAKALLDQSGEGVLVYGPGASLLQRRGCLLVLADMARWEIQRRQRTRLVDSLGCSDRNDDAWTLYRRGYFVDWRIADDQKRAVWELVDFVLDTNTPGSPRLVRGQAVRAGLKHCVTRPFRVVPFFDPGVWGGQWMKEVCDLPRDVINYAWCFDCVPEENSLLLRFGGQTVELPSIDLVFQEPLALLGEAVYGRFGAEFPIRFDFLDTMGGGNLSLQVHPKTEYARKVFGMPYTQDESYYLLDAEPDACVYLGVKTGIDRDEFFDALQRAQQDPNQPLDADRFVNRFQAKKHDHFLIPAGTVHCSGKNAMVLEISATPYIFTCKLWDWGRLDLNGKPRPISLGHGSANIDYSRDTDYARRRLINQVVELDRGPGWRMERTGLHPAEFIETHRHWFTVPVEHETRGTVHVLNLVEGEQVTVESPTEAFEPFVVHYAETFIVPAAVGRYRIRPSGSSQGRPYATMKAFVRCNP